MRVNISDSVAHEVNRLLLYQHGLAALLLRRHNCRDVGKVLLPGVSELNANTKDASDVACDGI